MKRQFQILGKTVACTALSLALVACLPKKEHTPQKSTIPMNTFGQVPYQRVYTTNPDLVRDFHDLFFKIESGAELSHFSRFEGPIRVRLAGKIPSVSNRDLDLLMNRLRSETGIRISRSDNIASEISVVPMPQATLSAAVPGAACFVVPGVSDWSGFRLARERNAISWTKVKQRTKAAVFLPVDASPQEIRDCLHEEIAQALGPLNDLDRLPNSVFNDNNVHSILTGFDMLMLRAAYDPSLETGMPREEVMKRIPAIFARLNPSGKSPQQASQTTNDAVSKGLVEVTRKITEFGEGGHLPHSYNQDGQIAGYAELVKGQNLMRVEPDAAWQPLEASAYVFAKSPAMRLSEAHALHALSIMDLRSGFFESAVNLANQVQSVAHDAQDAMLLADSLLVQSTALSSLGHSTRSKRAKSEAIRWGRYAFGDQTRLIDWLDQMSHLH